MDLLNRYSKMINKKISNYQELQAAISELNASKTRQEELLKQNVSGIKEALNPLNLVKSYLKKVTEDKELHRDALKASIGIGAQFILGKLFKTNKSPKRQFFATLFEKVITGLAK